MLPESPKNNLGLGKLNIKNDKIRGNDVIDMKKIISSNKSKLFIIIRVPIKKNIIFIEKKPFRPSIKLEMLIT